MERKIGPGKADIYPADITELPIDEYNIDTLYNPNKKIKEYEDLLKKILYNFVDFNKSIGFMIGYANNYEIQLKSKCNIKIKTKDSVLYIVLWINNQSYELNDIKDFAEIPTFICQTINELKTSKKINKKQIKTLFKDFGITWTGR